MIQQQQQMHFLYAVPTVFLAGSVDDYVLQTTEPRSADFCKRMHVVKYDHTQNFIDIIKVLDFNYQGQRSNRVAYLLLTLAHSISQSRDHPHVDWKYI